MNDDSSLNEEVYHPEEIPDHTTEFLNKIQEARAIEKARLDVREAYETKKQRLNQLKDPDPLAKTKLTKKVKDKELQELIKKCKLKGKEAILIKKLGDMDKHTVEELREATKSEAVSQLKSTVKKKIEEIGWTIIDFRGSWDNPTKWQLQNLT